ncbi:hypothetical protein [Desulfosporosinus sp. BG]|uniref:hypothetical protein n=1 Tax=Desulfosporosinus sp. BG TaxID=1633135 RepID=UPI00083A2610|nr:hypothetical protein [Desulfosporosinus sp. BG]ODA42233.1 hypothetical protein DSBG_1061 [Desulfosporosinus sp. BG]
MKQTNVWLSPEELKQMLKGSLQWIDVASRATSFRKGFQKSDEESPEKHSVPLRPEQMEHYLPKKEKYSSKRFEGQPVIWLLGSVALLTLSSWFYFVLFSK